MSQVDPNTIFTGGCKIVFTDFKGYVCEAHIALEQQPLSCFVDSVIEEKKMAADGYEIIYFNPQTNNMQVRLQPATH